ncbi:MAG TPA: helix-turn-helix domain-containing protein, partial [Candidatus Binatia bacterium]|nr:helix-turn-helix domain-containing protein [Candidatus Binatia bacterium]
MLTPKNDGPGEDFFSDASHRSTDEPVGAYRKKPLSQILREEREHKNLSLQEVAKLTHIPLNYLQLLEGARDERVVPDSLYLIASLRGYAAFLDIDQGAVLTQFIAELDQGPPVEKAGGSRRPTYLRNYFPQLRSRVSPRTLSLLFILGILALVGYYSELTQGPRPKEATVAPLPAPSVPQPAPQPWTPPPASSPALSASPPEARQPQPTSSPPAVSPPAAAAPQAEPPSVSTPRVEPLVENSSPQPQNSPGRSPHRLRVQAKEQTWLRVTIDDQPAKEMLLRPGQVVEW